jgi:hypothetical protein
MGCFSLEEHLLLTGGKKILVMRREFHQTLRVIGSLFENLLLYYASLSPARNHYRVRVEGLKAPTAQLSHYAVPAAPECL